MPPSIGAAAAAETNEEDPAAATAAAAVAAVVTNKTAESLLADELNKLSFGERETANEEIHGIGVGAVLAEEETDPSKMEASLRGLRNELDKLCNNLPPNPNATATASATNTNINSTALRRSRELFRENQNTYIHSDEVGKMFLRCERFDCRKAAIRLCHYAEFVHDLYGDKGLEQRIKQSDIPPEDLAVMRKGRTQILPGRDRAGRKVYVHFYSEAYMRLPLRTRLRIGLYFCMALLQDVDCQRRGFVCLFWMHNFRIQIHQFLASGALHAKYSLAMPIRIGAIHYLLPSSDAMDRTGISYALAKIVARIGSQFKRQLRMHWGSPMESFYVLQSFGISSKDIPLHTDTWQLDLTNNNRWLESCAARETAPDNNNTTATEPSPSPPPLPPPTPAIIETPRPTDVLFGRGRSIMYHPGNTMFRKYVEHHLDDYSGISSRKLVVKWTKDVVHTLQTRHGVRFLKEATSKDNNNEKNHRKCKQQQAWVEVSSEVARAKVRSAFRDTKKKKRLTNNNNNNSSSSGKPRHDTPSSPSPSPVPMETVSNVPQREPIAKAAVVLDDATIDPTAAAAATTATATQQEQDQAKANDDDRRIAYLDSIEINLDATGDGDELQEQGGTLDDGLLLFQNDDDPIEPQTVDSSTSLFLGLTTSGGCRERDCCSSSFG